MASPGGDDQAMREVHLRSFRRVSVVIPAKNEENNLGWVMRRLPIEVDEVILVDGNSSDRTIEVALSIRPDTVVVNDRIPGKGAALRAGFAAATGDYIVMLDADGSMDPVEINAFIAALDAGHDLAKGSRFLADGGTSDISPIRQLGNVVLLTIANVLFRTRQTDLCYGYAAFRREAIAPLTLDAQGFEIESQLFLRAIANRLSVTEIPSFEAAPDIRHIEPPHVSRRMAGPSIDHARMAASEDRPAQGSAQGDRHAGDAAARRAGDERDHGHVDRKNARIAASSQPL